MDVENPTPLTDRERVEKAGKDASGFDLKDFQVKCTLWALKGLDVLCIAPTGSGKSLLLVLATLSDPLNTMTWIVSPLNYIEEQQAEQFRAYKLRAVAVNAHTLNDKLLEDIENGEYQVVISSPESFGDSNKLRKCIMSRKLRHKRHIVAIDEAHCIYTWGTASGFRKDYEEIGRMRVFLPERTVFIAVTATCPERVKTAITGALSMKKYRYLNMGCFRPDLCHKIVQMTGGKKSYSEVVQFFPKSPPPDEEALPTVVFVESRADAHHVADVLRTHLGVSGDEARRRVAVYHSLRKKVAKDQMARRFRQGKTQVLVSTEALTMGADFPNVKQVIQYLPPEDMITSLQRSGRAARRKGLTGVCITMVPPRTYQKALRICADAGDRMTQIETDVDQEQSDEEPEDSHSEHDGDPRDDKEERGDGERTEDEVEEPEATQDNELAEQPGRDRTGANNRSQRRKKAIRPPMDLALAHYLTTPNCLVEALDAEFGGPEHIPCIEVSGCYNCVARHARREARTAQESLDTVDIHRDERPRNNPVEETYEETQETQGATQSRRRKQVDRMVRQGKELAPYLEALQSWRWETFDRTL